MKYISSIISTNNKNNGILMIIVFGLVFLHRTESGIISTTPELQKLTTQSNQLNSEAPREFPDHQSQHPLVLHNKTIRDNLANHSNETELDNLRAFIHATNVITLSYNNSDKELLVPSEEEEEGETSPVLKSNVELIENGENTEDAIVLKKMAAAAAGEEKTEKKSEDEDTPYPVFKGQVAGILAGTFLVVSILAYLGLLSWRRYLEMKYGSREMLVNEEDFVVSDDLKNFSL